VENSLAEENRPLNLEEEETREKTRKNNQIFLFTDMYIIMNLTINNPAKLDAFSAIFQNMKLFSDNVNISLESTGL
jgi:hypothetical protein